MKWEPVAAMAAVVLLGLWLVYAPGVPQGLPPLRAGSFTMPLKMSHGRGEIEVTKDVGGELTFRVLRRDGHASSIMTAEQFRDTFGDREYQSALKGRANPIFKLLNITSWGSLIWVALGLGGQLAFSGRMIVQWFVSEKERRSVVPEAFWWMSLAGGVLLFSYFAWRQDIVGVLGQSSGLVIYARNIRLIYKQRRRDARNAEKEARRRAAAAEPAIASPEGEPFPTIETRPAAVNPGIAKPG